MPQHPVSTGGFLIARHETTYAQWIEFLRALPATERRELLSGTDPSAFRGHVALSQAADGSFGLKMQIGPSPVSAAEGERLVFPGRNRRRAVDWLQLPVSGISYADSQRYLAWLVTSGRVPGARFCTEIEWERAARGADSAHLPGQGNRLEPDWADSADVWS